MISFFPRPFGSWFELLFCLNISYIFHSYSKITPIVLIYMKDGFWYHIFSRWVNYPSIYAWSPRQFGSLVCDLQLFKSSRVENPYFLKLTGVEKSSLFEVEIDYNRQNKKDFLRRPGCHYKCHSRARSHDSSRKEKQLFESHIDCIVPVFFCSF